MSDENAGLVEYLKATAAVAVSTAVCYLLRSRLQTTDVAMLYLLAVVTVASRYRLGAAIFASVLSIATFDFLFVPPYYTFNVHNAAYFLTFGVMLAVAVLMSRLTARLREQADEARERERRTSALYEMNRELTETGDRKDQVVVVARHLARVTGGDAILQLLDETDGRSERPAWPAEGPFESLAVRVAASWAHEQGEPAGMGTAHCAEADALVVPLRTLSHRIGVAVVRPGKDDGFITATERRTVEVLAEQAAVVLERALLAEQHQRATLEVEAERLRTALLSSLSHDLRTPLGSIEGAASSLLHDAALLPLDLRRDLAETILEESHRMSRLVANLLDMVRVETGGLAVQKTWQPLEETLGVALLRLEERLQHHPVDIKLPDDLPLVPIDELLIEQVFINLLENAAKHTPLGTLITVSAWRDGSEVLVEVADRGPGIPAGAEESVFQKFYRSPGVNHAGGVGLGLTICRGIVVAHGGRVWAEPHPAGGAAFRFALPLQGPEVAPLPADPDDG